jgi:hypothetical protein
VTRETRPFASEVKFLVEAGIAEDLRRWIRSEFQADPHGSGAFGDEYTTTSLYFDTVEGDVFHRRGSFGRSKYRVRRYGSSGAVYLERKLRRPGVLAKRRTLVPVEALDRLSTAELDAGWTGAWFHRRLLLRQIRPVCQVSYSRMARVGSTPAGAARLTLDEGLSVAAVPSTVRFGPARGVTFLPEHLILELKFAHDLPAIFKRLVEAFGLVPRPASKYRMAAAALGDIGFPLLPAPGNDGQATHV